MNTKNASTFQKVYEVKTVWHQDYETENSTKLFSSLTTAKEFLAQEIEAAKIDYCKAFPDTKNIKNILSEETTEDYILNISSNLGRTIPEDKDFLIFVWDLYKMGYASETSCLIILTQKAIN